MRSSLRACAAVAITSVGAGAQISPLSGVQTSDGSAWAGPTLVSNYSIAAPNPIESWSPPHQTAAASAAGQSSSVGSDWSSTIGPGSVLLSTSVTAGNSFQTPENGAGWSYDQQFHRTFTIGSPGVYQMSAELWRETDFGWSFTDASAVTFGREGDPLIMNLANQGQMVAHVPHVVSYPPVFVSLGPGTYTVDAIDRSTWGLQGNSVESRMTFSLTAVPGPGAVELLAVMAIVGRRRGRRFGVTMRDVPRAA